MDERLQRLAHIACRHHGLFTRAHARAVGLDRHALRHGSVRGRWTALTPAVFCMAGVPVGPLTTAMAAGLDAGDGAVLSHTAAAWLLGIPGFAASPIHVTRPGRAERRPTRAIVHRSEALPSEHITRVAGIPVTSMARTLFDVGGMVHPGRLERAVDTALARQLVTLDELHAVVTELGAPGRPGGRALRHVLADRLPGEAPPESELERRFLALLRRHGLPLPRRQVAMGDDRAPAGRVDCYFPEARLVVELDGRAFHSAPLDREADAHRDLVVLRGGSRVLRLTWRQVTRSPEEVVDTLREVLRCAA